jgi:superfamily II DNA or RNA helicase
MIKILIGNITSKMVGHLPDSVHLELDSHLSYFIAGAKHSIKYKKGWWDGIAHLYYKDRGQSFYTGLLSVVCEVLTKNEIPFKKVDRRTVPDQNLPFLEFCPPVGFQERDYQDFTISRSISRTRGILKVATGGGKTMIVAQMIGELKTAPFIFYVLTKDLMDQAYDTLSATLNVPIGRIGGGHFDIKDINVCTIQTVIRALNDSNKKFKISDYLFDDEDIWDEKDLLNSEKVHAIRTLLGATKGIYLDEMHHASATTVREVLSASPKAYWRFGGTATPYREDNSELVLQGLFGKKIVDISASYLIEKGYLLKPYILFDPILHDYVPKAYPSVYSKCVAKNDLFHAQVSTTANHMIDRGLSTLILVKQYAHGEALKKLIPNTEFVTGKLSTKRRSEAIQDLRDKKSMCMIATTLADEGLDIPSLDAALLAGGGASPTRVNQRVGRTLRPDRASPNPRDKSIVVVYDHKARFLDKQTRNTRKILKAEPQFELVNSQGGGYILGEIDEIMGTGGSTSIFDI